MSAVDPAGLRALAFGSADGSLWGAALESGAGTLALGYGAPGGSVTAVAEGLEWIETDRGEWRITGDGVQLTATRRTAPVPADGVEPPPGRPHVAGDGPELCDVRGTVSGGEIDGIGVRSVLAPASSAKAAPATVRLVGAWFPDGAGFAVLAARPRRNAHQDGDVSVATLFDPERWTAVDEPRLSTTYDAGGSPARCNAELWISDGEDEFPRRGAGEAAGAGVTAATDGLAIEVVPLRCHARGEDGVGVYALATFS